jgi:site-specific DNA-methyltransferase (adenine-specific)
MENVIEKKEFDVITNGVVKHFIVKELRTTIRPVYKNNETALYSADCLEVMARFPENYIDMIFADPPYNLSNGGVTCYAGKMVSVNKGK